MEGIGDGHCYDAERTPPAGPLGQGKRVFVVQRALWDVS